MGIAIMTQIDLETFCQVLTRKYQHIGHQLSPVIDDDLLRLGLFENTGDCIDGDIYFSFKQKFKVTGEDLPMLGHLEIEVELLTTQYGQVTILEYGQPCCKGGINELVFSLNTIELFSSSPVSLCNEKGAVSYMKNNHIILSTDSAEKQVSQALSDFMHHYCMPDEVMSRIFMQHFSAQYQQSPVQVERIIARYQNSDNALPEILPVSISA
ncbi:hypothetical protein BKE30_13415 [Alkanindiges hydrocarboniclasticus]|uniref:Uncharacterized protein n=2 Tax=Alkanindiges hydrocarboniclasticus TaxID=1907941 RepID=A0A1S8CRR3_9GAMM|nr:hypothetical protein BKE30_13415 [Alkanindiges hydrocarboniclasticus]